MKKMIVNCALCDMTGVQEETLAAYESISINSAIILVSPETKNLIARYPVQMNAAQVTEAPAGTELRQLNGECVISADSCTGKSIFLMVNGKVVIEKGAFEAAQSYRSIQVNGKVIAPRSIVDRLTNLNVNGKIIAYPDDAVLMKSTEVIDRFFALRAKKALYYADKCIVLTDRAIDAQRIIEKGVSFETPRVIIAESFCEALVPLINEKAEIIVVPDGTCFVNGDSVLDKNLISRYGNRLYISGDLTVKDGEAIGQVKNIRVKGKVYVTEALSERFLDLDAEYDEIEIIREYGCELRDKAMAKVDRKLLEKNPAGVLVCDCAILKIDRDVEEELILERLTIRDVANVNCSAEQEAAVTAVSEDVARINGGGESLLQKMLGHDPDTKVINAAKYVM